MSRTWLSRVPPHSLLWCHTWKFLRFFRENMAVALHPRCWSERAGSILTFPFVSAASPNCCKVFSNYADVLQVLFSPSLSCLCFSNVSEMWPRPKLCRAAISVLVCCSSGPSCRCPSHVSALPLHSVGAAAWARSFCCLIHPDVCSAALISQRKVPLFTCKFNINEYINRNLSVSLSSLYQTSFFFSPRETLQMKICLGEILHVSMVLYRLFFGLF